MAKREYGGQITTRASSEAAEKAKPLQVRMCVFGEGPPPQAPGVHRILEGGLSRFSSASTQRSPCQFSGSHFFPIKALTLALAGNPTFSQLLLFLPLSLPAAGDEGHCKKLPEVPSFLALILCFKLLINRSASHFFFFKFPRPYSYSFPHTLNACLIEPVNAPLSTRIPTRFSTGKGLSNHQAGN